MRPSEYRTVTLANFMAFLDTFMQLLQNHILLFFTKKIENRTKDYEYTSVILKKFRNVEIFSDIKHYERKLS